MTHDATITITAEEACRLGVCGTCREEQAVEKLFRGTDDGKEAERLTEQLENLKSNRRRYPAGLPGDGGPCECPIHESHDGRCLGSYCYCH